MFKITKKDTNMVVALSKYTVFFLMFAVVVAAISITNSNAYEAKHDQISQREIASSASDYDAIRNVINLYIEAGKEARSEIMKPAFHKDAIIYGTAGAEVTGGPIQGLFDYIDSHPKATGLKAQITNIDVANNIAHVRVESDNWNGARYSDMFLLLKENNVWKIITKIYFDHK